MSRFCSRAIPELDRRDDLVVDAVRIDHLLHLRHLKDGEKVVEGQGKAVKRQWKVKEG